MPEAQYPDRFRHTVGLRFIQRQRPARRDRAVMAAAGADLAEDQERRRPIVPALPDVRAPRLFADRMEVQLLGKPPNLPVIRPLVKRYLEPRRQMRPWLLHHRNRTTHNALACSSARLKLCRNCAAAAPSTTR